MMIIVIPAINCQITELQGIAALFCRHITSMDIDHAIISLVILQLLLIQEGQFALVTDESTVDSHYLNFTYLE